MALKVIAYSMTGVDRTKNPKGVLLQQDDLDEDFREECIMWGVASTDPLTCPWIYNDTHESEDSCWLMEGLQSVLQNEIIHEHGKLVLLVEWGLRKALREFNELYENVEIEFRAVKIAPNHSHKH